MTHRFLVLCFSIVLSLCSMAQEESTPFVSQPPLPSAAPAPGQEAQPVAPFISIGYLSYDSALHAMPGYALAQARLDGLRQAYEAEMKRVEAEFNEKYEAFLDGLKDYPRTILLKRQTELQQLMQQNLDFKRQGLDDLRQAGEEAMRPLRDMLSLAIAAVARQKGLAVVVNTDANACPFIDPEMGLDIQEEVGNWLSAPAK